MRFATQGNRCMWHLQGSESVTCWTGKQSLEEKKGVPYFPQPSSLKGWRTNWKVNLGNYCKSQWEQQYGFGQSSQLYLSSEYFLHRDTLTCIKELDFFFPLRWGINKLLRNYNLSIITKENKRNVLRTAGNGFRPSLF